jgi:hypothetical protein
MAGRPEKVKEPAMNALPAAFQSQAEPSQLAQDLAAFSGPISVAQAELYVAELDIRIAKLWTEEQSTPRPADRRRLETERTELETIRADLWFSRLHPEQAIMPEPSFCAVCGTTWPNDAQSYGCCQRELDAERYPVEAPF